MNMDHKEFWFRFSVRFIHQPVWIVIITGILMLFSRPLAVTFFQVALPVNVIINAIFFINDLFEYIDFLKYRHRVNKAEH